MAKAAQPTGTWYVEAPSFDGNDDKNLWHRTEAEARATFNQELARVRGAYPGMVHMVRLIHVQKTIVEVGRDAR